MQYSYYPEDPSTLELRRLSANSVGTGSDIRGNSSQAESRRRSGKGDGRRHKLDACSPLPESTTCPHKKNLCSNDGFKIYIQKLSGNSYKA